MLAALEQMRPRLPEPRQRAGELKVTFAVRVARQVERRAQIVVLEREHRGPVPLADEALRVGAIGEGEELGEVPLPRGLRLSRLDQALLSVLAHGLEQTVAGIRAALALHHHQRLVDQAREQVHDLELVRRLARHPGRRFQRPPTREHREPPEQTLLLGRELVVAPLDRRPQGLVPRHRGPAAAGQQAEAIIQPGSDLIQREDPDPRRGQLDGERDPVEAAADLRHRGRVLLGERELGQHGARPVHEQLHRLGGLDGVEIARLRRGHLERAQGE